MKLIALKESVSICMHKILVLTETNLSTDVSSAEMGLQNFNLFRMDRSPLTSLKQSGGGVLVAVHNDFPSHEITSSVTNVEHIFVYVKLPGLNALICAVYIPPNSPSDLYSSFYRSVEEVCLSLEPGSLILIAGDLNQPNTNWNNDTDFEVSINSRYLMDLADFFQLTQINKVLNARGVLLDLVFSSNPELRVSTTDDPLVTLDVAHPALVIDIWDHQTLNRTPRVFVPDVKRCNLDRVFAWMQRQPYPETSSLHGIEDSFVRFCEELREIIISNCPLKPVGKPQFPCWFSKELKSLVKRKKLFHKKFKTSHNLVDLEKFREIRGQCKRLARVCHSNYIASIDQQLIRDPKSFWKHVSGLRKSDSSQGILRLDGRVATAPADMCELFADFFSSTYALPTAEAPDYNYMTDVNLATIYITAMDVEKKLKNLDSSKGSGPDDIPAGVLKYCSEPLAPLLALFFNGLLKTGIFPGNLKVGFLIPIHKSGERADPRNYRPIVIQPALAKVFESLVLDGLSFAFKNIFITQQHGFRQGRSTATNLTVFVSTVLSAFENGNQLDCIYLDFAKAFDRISHPHLLKKLEALGVNGSLLKWFKSYLESRIIQVRYSSALSRPIRVTSGVPQGSHLGPFLFSIFINDIGEYINGGFLLFADDVKVFREVSSVQHQVDLQQDLEGIERWCLRNRMDLNPTKCCIMSFSRARGVLLYDYCIQDTIVSRKYKVKDLGVLLTPTLDFGDHIGNICSSANRTLGLISRTCRYGFSVVSMKTLYVTLVRPIMEFSVTVWAPHQVGHCSRLDDVQKRFLRLVGVKLGHRYLDVDLHEMEHQLHLPQLAARRTLLDLLFLYKIVNNQIDCPEILHQLSFGVPRNTRRPQLFARSFHPTNYLYYSTMPRLMRVGNDACGDLDFFCSSASTFRERALRLVLRWSAVG